MVDLAGELPSALRAAAEWRRLGRSSIPTMLVHPDRDTAKPVPAILWLHGRTVTKEIDPGRYLRWLRRGIGACAADLPGHGERYDASLQEPSRTLEVVLQMVDEIDELLEALDAAGLFDMSRLAIGGMSAGGMATLVRLCRDHPFRCASVEATSGSWRHQRHRAMFRDMTPEELDRYNPIEHLEGWREIPFQAFHAEKDEWVAVEGQAEFVAALREQYDDSAKVEFVRYEHTGAPYEHAGFGRKSAEAKNRQAAFFEQWLAQSPV